MLTEWGSWLSIRLFCLLIALIFLLPLRVVSLLLERLNIRELFELESIELVKIYRPEPLLPETAALMSLKLLLMLILALANEDIRLKPF